MANNELETDNKKNKEQAAPLRGVRQAKQPTKKTKKKTKKAKRKLGKEMISELKKVSWPTFSKVVKQTGVVIAVVVVFAVVLLGFDKLFSIFYNMIVSLGS